jgi:hypothetical protein
MHAKVLIASMVGMAIVTRIKNENLRASLGIPLVAVIMFMLLSLSVSAQWIPDRQEYNVVSKGNFYTTEPDMATALSTALSTLQYNGAKMHTLNVDKKDINSPLFNYFIRSNEEDMVYVAYVARTKSNDYVVWFKFLPNETTEFEEEFVILEYVK